ncbi:16S rRNA (cytosine967-C5)-methyltransferase [Rhodovulum imhoffii]|uniref:16S rRNA (Cytosine967-C5)-methyltransferase n=1 Tax=Rhodovulum imhoffii TaxID=365340 RepID=A0A2T5BVD7_9RHOB|nr:RsmB/NOP family class I SAM-dependent RNA methyltransferase [Rhodovulum imhoffii]MBK5934248.1 SAM-dependent methyltransferase [Rhodovulum imhoffii]PTN03505.1 16S rRNA (cytosine967-C5)-methyltransferase [Rhodovulum imhoffii]
MTPQARLAAAIGIMDSVLAGASAEQTLTTWARKHRYAGSGDRAAIRDLVFSAIRCRRSYGTLGGAETGRGLMLGYLRDRGEDPAAWFTGGAYAPDVLSAAEKDVLAREPALPGNVACDCPDWLAPRLRQSLGDEFLPVMKMFRQRAPVFLRVNRSKASTEQAVKSLICEGIEVQAHPLSPTALEAVGNPRRIQQARAYRDGWVELQDAASQAVCDRIPLRPQDRVLDYCAGGGGKSLALAARGACDILAHDADATRMRDIPMRAARAGGRIRRISDPASAAPYDVVLCDVPCSGSGAWRRSPEGKWRLTEKRLKELQQVQAEILARAAQLVASGGWLAYATCSVLQEENEQSVSRFLEDFPEWRLGEEHRFSPLDGGDGFFLALLSHT